MSTFRAVSAEAVRRPITTTAAMMTRSLRADAQRAPATATAIATTTPGR